MRSPKPHQVFARSESKQGGPLDIRSVLAVDGEVSPTSPGVDPNLEDSKLPRVISAFGDGL
jgi:hypothetical protein